MADKDKIPIMAMPVATAVYRSQQTKGIILCADMDERAMVIERSEAMGMKLKPAPLLYEELRHNHLMAAPELSLSGDELLEELTTAAGGIVDTVTSQLYSRSTYF